VTRKCRRCGDLFETDRQHHRLCWPCYWHERHAQERRPPSKQQRSRSLDARLLRGAIALCHPDRHPPERAKTANAVTAALLDLLDNERSNQ
jgi:predicted  nucleic acid-binding Zn-ribbon protein